MKKYLIKKTVNMDNWIHNRRDQVLRRSNHSYRLVTPIVYRRSDHPYRLVTPIVYRNNPSYRQAGAKI
jgi:hypothetical protein